MTIALLVTLVILVVAVVWREAEQYFGRIVARHRRVVVNLVDDRAVSGILWRRHPNIIVVRGGELIEMGREPVAMDGDVLIERDRINWIQVVGT